MTNKINYIHLAATTFEDGMRELEYSKEDMMLAVVNYASRNGIEINNTADKDAIEAYIQWFLYSAIDGEKVYSLIEKTIEDEKEEEFFDEQHNK